MIVAFYLRTVLGLLFVTAGVSKLWDRRAFLRAVTGFRIVPPRLAPVVCAIVVSLELAGGAMLVTGIWEWLGALLLAILLAAFNLALILNLLRGRRNLDCGCFGPRTTQIGWGHVAQNTLLLGAALPAGAASSSGDVSSAAVTILAAAYTVVAFLTAQEMAGVRSGLVRMLSRIQTE